MTKPVQANKVFKKNTERLNNEIKLHINQKLYDKHIISEDMYLTAKAALIKQAG